MKNRLCEIMQHGFLIYAKESVFVLKKISVPDNKEPFIESIWDVKEFETFEDAVVFAERKIIDIKGPQWQFQVVVVLKGIGPTIRDLGMSDAMLQEEADALCKEKAQDYVEENFKSSDVKDWTYSIWPFLTPKS